MACELLLASSFPELQKHLLARIRSLCEDQPLRSRWILTPTSTLAEHCRLQLSRLEPDIALAGVHVMPFSQFSWKLLQHSGPPSLPRDHPTLDLLLVSLSQRLTGVLSGSTSWLALRPTFLDLAEGGFGLEQRELLNELAGEGDLSRVEKTVLSLYAAWLETLDASGLRWEPFCQQELAKWIDKASETDLQQTLNLLSSTGSTELLVYGFYDFTDVSTQILVALGRRFKLTLYYPFAAQDQTFHPAFSFSDAVLTDLSLRFGSALEKQTVLGDPGLSGRVTKFFIETFPEGTCSERPPFLTSQKASGIRAEVLSAAVRIRKWLDEEPGSISPSDILLLAPNIELYYEEVREIFSAFSIPLRIAEQPTQGTKEIRALSMLKQLWRSRGETEWVLALLREFPSLSARRQISLDEFENKLRELPVAGGNGWKRLESLVMSTDDQALPSFSQAEVDLISEIVTTWVERPESGYSIRQAYGLMISCSEGWLEEPTLLAPALQALRTMEELLPDLMIPEEMIEMLFSRPQTPSPSEDTRLPGVLFSTIMRARGVTAEALVILGLSLGRFPARVEEDPLLSDLSRKRLMRLASDVGHRLSVKSRMVDEMSLLFFLLNTSAKKVHWVIPETDESGKSVAPTPWVQRYLHRWSDDPSASTQQWRLIPRGPVEQAFYLYGLDPKTGTLLPPRFAAFLNTRIRLPTATVNQSEGDPSWYGKIQSAAISGKNHPERLSVTELESLARCPYHFYVRVLAGWTTIRPQQFVIEPDALAWGSLVHNFLENLFHAELGPHGSLLDLLPDSETAPFWDESKAASQLPLWSRLLPEPLRIALAQRLSRTVAAYLNAVKNGKCSNGSPVALETKIRLPYPGREYLTISGQIDRVDDRQGRFAVVDYKSGQQPWTSREDRALEIKLGYRLQPLLYPWLYQTDRSLPYSPEFSFVFLGKERPQEILISEPEVPEELLFTLANLLEEGNFFPISNELTKQWGFKRLAPCRYCELSSLCRRFDLNIRRRGERLMEVCASDRLSQILGQRQRRKKYAG